MKLQTQQATPRVMAVDDDDASRIMLKAALESAGYEVDVTHNPTDVIAAAEAGEISVVISDWNMPGMTGIELCRAIRALGGERYIYLILLTSRSDPDEIVTGLDSGADDFVIKPFNPRELAKRVEIGLRTCALDTRDATIFALAKLAESRDPETGAHLERVQNYARALSEAMLNKGLHPDVIDQAFVALIHATTPLHDIGKVAVPDSILLKPGQLSDTEFDVMKSHTLIGAETLKAVADRYPDAPFLRTACEIARSHHERWDGSGYPDGLSGTDIPLAARIMALADVYDALVSKRVYKAAMEHDVAVRIISESAGSHFDPQLVEIFLEIEAKFNAIHAAFQEDPGTNLKTAA